VSCFSTSVAREWKWLHFLTSINIHWNRVSGGWSMLVVCAPLRSLKSNGVEGGWTGWSRSNTRSLVRRSEGFIGGSVLVNGSSCSVPVHWNHVRGMSRRHGVTTSTDSGFTAVIRASQYLIMPKHMSKELAEPMNIDWKTSSIHRFENG